MNHKSFFWLVPFVSFWCGYQLLGLLLNVYHVEAPDIVGKSLSEVLPILSHAQLNPRVLQQKEDPDIPEGIVLSQQPAPGQKMRPQASLFLVISKKPPTPIAPDLRGKMEKEIQKIVRERNLGSKIFYLTSELPSGSCIGQLPSAQSPVADRKLIIYISNGNQQPILFPNLRGMNVEHVCRFFSDLSINPPHITHTSAQNTPHTCNHCVVVDQKPLARSLINPHRLPDIHLNVSHEKN